MLEDLVAEREVEAPIRDGERLHRSKQIGVRVLDRVDAYIRRRVRGEERLVRFLAASDVEHPVPAEIAVGAPGLLLEPAREWRPHRIGR